jgi:hypothetical protein
LMDRRAPPVTNLKTGTCVATASRVKEPEKVSP